MYIVNTSSSEPSELLSMLIYHLEILLNEQMSLKQQLDFNYSDRLALLYTINISTVDEQIKLIKEVSS